MNYNSKTISLFLVKFLLIFGLLLGLSSYFNGSKHYAAYFKAVGNYWFYEFNNGCRVAFMPSQKSYDIQMELVSPEFIEIARKEGKKHPQCIPTYIDHHIFLYSCLLLVSLLLASPISWRRKLIALLPSLGLMQVYLIVYLSIIIYHNYQMNEHLPVITNFSLFIELLNWLDYAVHKNVGLHLLIPVAIWILVSFRSSDFNQLLRSKEPATPY